MSLTGDATRESSKEPLDLECEPSPESDSLAEISPLFDSATPSSSEMLGHLVEKPQRPLEEAAKRKEGQGLAGMDLDAFVTEEERIRQIDCTHSIIRGVRKVGGKAVEEALRSINRIPLDVPAAGQCCKICLMLGIGMEEECLPSFMQANLDFLQLHDSSIRTALRHKVAIADMDKTMMRLTEMYQKPNAWIDFEGLQVAAWAFNATIHIHCMADGIELAVLEADRDWGPTPTHPRKKVYLYLRRDKATPIYGLDYKPLPNAKGDGQAMADGHYKVALTFEEAAKVEEARRSRQGNGRWWPVPCRSPP